MDHCSPLMATSNPYSDIPPLWKTPSVLSARAESLFRSSKTPPITDCVSHGPTSGGTNQPMKLNPMLSDLQISCTETLYYGSRNFRQTPK
jgi:hypothetical protein